MAFLFRLQALQSAKYFKCLDHKRAKRRHYYTIGLGQITVLFNPKYASDFDLFYLFISFNHSFNPLILMRNIFFGFLAVIVTFIDALFIDVVYFGRT